MNESSTFNDNLDFVMHGAREILEISAGAVHIERTIIALERSVNEEPGLAFDLSKALIESICKTILTDIKDPIIDRDNKDLPHLVKHTAKQLKLVPETHSNPQVQDSFQRVINGLENAVRGLCEIRKLEGTASHGRDGYSKSLEPLQAMFAARAADAIVNFLFKAHKTHNMSSVKRIVYSDYPDFNNYLDDSYGSVNVGNLTYKISEVLHTLDQFAYFELYREYLEFQLEDKK